MRNSVTHFQALGIKNKFFFAFLTTIICKFRNFEKLNEYLSSNIKILLLQCFFDIS